MKRVLLSLSVILLLFSCVRSMPLEKRDNALLLRMSVPLSSEHPHAKASEYFARMVTRETEGRVNIKVYYDSELGNDKAVLDQISFGGIGFTLVDGKSLADNIALFQAILPQISRMSRTETLAWCRLNYSTILDSLSEYSIVPVALFYPKLTVLLHPVSDCRKSENRIGVIGGEFSSRILTFTGMEGRQIERSDIRSSLIDGYIDHLFDSLVDLSYSDIELQKETITVLDRASLPAFLIMNKDLMDLISKEDMKIIRSAATRSALYADNLLERMEDKILSSDAMKEDDVE